MLLFLFSPDELDCLWNRWSKWTSCRDTCPYRLRNRTRVKGHEKALFDGEECLGPEVKRELCHHEICPNETGFIFMYLIVQSCSNKKTMNILKNTVFLISSLRIHVSFRMYQRYFLS